MKRLRSALVSLLLPALLAACASSPTAPSPAASPSIPEQVSHAARERDMQGFAERDAASPPPKGAVLFIGSSSIRLWDTLASDFPGVSVINRGFGGSEIRDSTWYADRIIVPYAPRMIVLYAGENDLESGRSPQQVRDDFHAFVARVRRDLPEVRIAYISSKPSPLRVRMMEAERQANALIEADAARSNVQFIDVFTAMLDVHGQPRGELFGEDRLHMNRSGYELWKRVVAPYLAGH